LFLSLGAATNRFGTPLASTEDCWRRFSLPLSGPARRARPRTHAAQAIGNRGADCTINAHPRAARRRTGRAKTSAAAKADREGIVRMAEKLVGKISEFKDGDRRIIFVGDHEIGVFRENGAFYAYSNYCLHQGGPACEGLTIAKVEERILPDKTSKGLYFSDTELHFVCPWHGYEYDIKTGECVSDRRLKLRKYDVIEKGDEVYVRA
jgi:nitrite reductase/ring-hydroxylating ferredoxin subunit